MTLGKAKTKISRAHISAIKSPMIPPDPDFKKKKFRAPKYTKKILHWCRRNNSKFAFFIFFMWGNILGIWGSLLAWFFIKPETGLMLWTSRITIGCTNATLAMALLSRFAVVDTKARKFFRRVPNNPPQPMTRSEPDRRDDADDAARHG